MLDFIWLEKILSSEVALPMVIALGVLWLVRELNRLRRQNEALYEKLIRYLELRVAELGNKRDPDDS